MVSEKFKASVASIVAFLVYVTYCVLTAIGLYGETSSVFPMAPGFDHHMLIMPTNAAWTIYIVDYVVTFLWLLYSLSCIFRQGNGTDILSLKFYLSFTISTCFSIGAAYTWYENGVVSCFIWRIFQMIFLMLAFGFSCFDLSEYLKTHEISQDNKCDVCCQRYLVQNGVQFGLATFFFVTILVASVFLNLELGASDFSVSLGLLIFVGVCTIVWFFVETFPLKFYTEYTAATYPAIIYYLCGVVSHVWDQDKTIGGFAVFFLVVTCVLFVVRVFMIAYRSSKRSSYETISFNVKSDNVQV